NYSALPEGPEPCDTQAPYERVSGVIPLTITLFDQLTNRASGYRAHYSLGAKYGERFNLLLVHALAQDVEQSAALYADTIDESLCRRSLLGPCTKFWFLKELTDPSAQARLLTCPERLCVPQWIEHWRDLPKPRKGLLAPMPETPAVLLNGSFVNDAGQAYEQ